MIFFPASKKIDEINLRCYNSIAVEYDDEDHATCRDFDHFTNIILNKFFTTHEIKENKRYLDIGVGTGKSLETMLDNNNSLIDFLISKKHSIDVLDISETMIQVVKNKFKNKISNYIQKSIFYFKPEKKYDFIVAALCDPYLTEKFLKIVYDILESDGYLILIFPSKNWIKQARRGICPNKTTFNSKDGKKYLSYSFSWDEGDLWKYLIKIEYHNRALKNYYLRELKKRMSKINANILSRNGNSGFCTSIITQKKIDRQQG